MRVNPSKVIDLILNLEGWNHELKGFMVRGSEI
jgi:hypothetical protein